ncbi:hypothetical protein FAVG1_11329 [Fusarium avenaceum]|nr:hypothetical protein FAVG1_11329 [Fusarium avenaceum]
MMLCNITSLILATLFITNTHARPSSELPPLHSRDEDNTTTIPSSNTTLEPVVPPVVDTEDYSIFALEKNVTLAWAGSPGSEPGSKRMRKRDNGVFSQANFTFRYPTVPLDHSAFVSDVSCVKGALSGVITNKAAYKYVKKEWTGAGKILFISSVDGCGDDHANDFFLSNSVSFADDTNTFTAKGSAVEYRDVHERFSLTWGPLGTLNVRRGLDKRAMFEPHALDKRDFGPWTIAWSRYLNDDDLLGTDDDAPWDDAAKLFSWGKEGGEEDDSYAKGEVSDPNGHHKRMENSTLSERELTYGLTLYCVECGFSGSASLAGAIDVGFFSIETAQVQFNMNFKAGLNLGLKAFVKYEKSWETELVSLNLPAFSIPVILSVGPYIGLGVEAKMEIEATGTLLIGSSVEWENVDILIDLLDSSNSHSNGLTPVFKPRTEASGELSMSASLGLPISVGIALDVFLFYEAKAGIKDTPSVVLEGGFSASAELNDDGEIETSIEGDCYGIAWNVHFENALDAFIDADGFDPLEFPLIEPLKSDPIAEGCIGYVNDGTGDDGGGSDGMSSGTGLGSGGSGMFGSRPGSQLAPVFDPLSTKKTGAQSNQKPAVQKGSTQSNKSSSTKKKTGGSAGSKSSSSTKKAKPSSTSTKPIKSTKTTSTKAKATTKIVQPAKNKEAKPTTTKAANAVSTSSPVCKPSAATNVKTPPGSICNRTVKKAKAPAKFVISTALAVKDVGACAEICLKNTQCFSFGYGSNKACQLYSKKLKSLGVTSGKGQMTSSFYDRACYAYSKCSK